MIMYVWWQSTLTVIGISPVLMAGRRGRSSPKLTLKQLAMHTSYSYINQYCYILYSIHVPWRRSSCVGVVLCSIESVAPCLSWDVGVSCTYRAQMWRRLDATQVCVYFFPWQGLSEGQCRESGPVWNEQGKVYRAIWKTMQAVCDSWGTG